MNKTEEKTISVDTAITSQLVSTESIFVDQFSTPGPDPFCQNAYPGVCSQYACDECFNTIITECAQCSQVAIVIIFCYFIAIGLAIVFGNALTICVGIKHHRDGNASKLDYCRTSLAVADMLTGKLNFKQCF